MDSSLNLHTLASSLPAGQQNAEKELLNNFKAAALSITTLYRSSRKNSKRAYNNGYAKACQDLLNFVQQGVSAGSAAVPITGPSTSTSSSSSTTTTTSFGAGMLSAVDGVDGGGMTIGRVMDWTEARLDAIKALEEDEDEDEEREKDRERGKSAPGTGRSGGAGTAAASSSSSSAPSKAGMPGPSTSDPIHRGSKPSSSSLPTPTSPTTQPTRHLPDPSSPSPPPSSTAHRPSLLRTAAPTSTTASALAAKTKSFTPSGKPEPIPFSTQSSNIPPLPAAASMFTFPDPFSGGAIPGSPTSTTAYLTPHSHSPAFQEPQAPLVIGAGAKRRHAMMMMLDSAGGAGAGLSPLPVLSSPSHVYSNGHTHNSTSHPPHPTHSAGTASSTYGATGAAFGAGSGARRRTRSSRNAGAGAGPGVGSGGVGSAQNQNLAAASEAMDVEEEGRERKRVARR